MGIRNCFRVSPIDVQCMYDIVVDTLVITLYSFFQNQLFLLQWCSLFIVTKFPALSLSLELELDLKP